MAVSFRPWLILGPQSTLKDAGRNFVASEVQGAGLNDTSFPDTVAEIL